MSIYPGEIKTEHEFKDDELVFHLVFVNKDHSLTESTKTEMVEAFGAVYPKLVRRFNKNAPRRVKFTVDAGESAYPALTRKDEITFSGRWFRDHPHDTDVVVHEIMHVVQDYNEPADCDCDRPSWLVEGIGDYVRNKYGRNNELAGWTMPKCYRPGQHYTDGYRVVAGFLTWLERTMQSAELIEELDSRLREGAYDKEHTWRELTGKSLDELWHEYSNETEPEIDVPNGVYHLINVNSGKLLDVDDDYSRQPQHHKNVHIFTRNDESPSQKWRIEHVAGGLSKISNIQHAGCVLDVHLSRDANGTNVHVYPDNGSMAQRWRLLPADDCNCNDNIVKLVSAVCTNRVLDVHQSGLHDRANVQVWDDNGTPAQKWKLEFLRK